MFFLGILLAVDALRCSGVLGSFSLWLDDTIGNVYAVNLIIGTLSAIVDNVPLVAGAIGMYPVASDAMVATAADPAYIPISYKTACSGNSSPTAPEWVAAC